MYNILMTSFETGFKNIKKFISKIIDEESKVVIIPWSFAVELKTKNISEFFNTEKKKK